MNDADKALRQGFLNGHLLSKGVRARPLMQGDEGEDYSLDTILLEMDHPVHEDKVLVFILTTDDVLVEDIE